MRGRPWSQRPLGFPAWADGQGPARTLVSKIPLNGLSPEGVRGWGLHSLSDDVHPRVRALTRV